MLLLHVDRLRGIQRSGDLVEYDSAAFPGAKSDDKVWREFHARGHFLEAAWEGEFRSQAAVWWLPGKKPTMDVRFALQVSPAPAAKAMQSQAVRPLPTVR